MTVTAIPLAAALPAVDRLLPSQKPPVPQTPATFSDALRDGVQGVNSSVLNAETMVRSFALDDSIPVHQVTFALEQARLQLELTMQIRQRLVEAYQQLMNMQL